VHFGLRKNGERVDPFNTDPAQNCNISPAHDLWDDTPPYRPGGLIAIGLFDRIPEYEEVKAGTPYLDKLSPTAPTLTIWGYVFAIRKDDVLRLSLAGPQGTVISKDIIISKPQVLAMRAIGKRKPNSIWPAGSYIGTVSFIRAGKTLEERTVSLEMP
jgi:hypothetical protein